MKLLLLLLVALGLPSYALRCRSCVQESPEVGMINPSMLCHNSSFPAQDCATDDNETQCMTMTAVLAIHGALEVRFNAGRCANSSLCQGQPYDECEYLNITVSQTGLGTLLSCSYWCCTGDLCNYVQDTSSTTSSFTPTSSISIQPTTSQVQVQASEAVSPAAGHRKNSGCKTSIAWFAAILSAVTMFCFHL